MADSRPIGAFDSGLGGLSVIKELEKVLPNENFVYFGDTGRVPYGTKSNETIVKYATEDEAFLLSKNVKLIIAACGTVSSVASHTKNDLPVPFIEVVTPASSEAVKATKNKKIGILGTSATVNSKSYENLILEMLPNAEITAVACPMFVQLVESGWIDKCDEVAVLTAKRYLQPLIDARVDTVILGCTHFPILSEIIGEILGESVTLINAGKCAADAAAKYLSDNGLLTDNTEKGECEFFVSDKIQNFSSVASILLGRDIESKVQKTDVSQFSK